MEAQHAQMAADIATHMEVLAKCREEADAAKTELAKLTERLAAEARAGALASTPVVAVAQATPTEQHPMVV
eukprot:2750881-Karenia_brevis.AAC.1